MRNFKETVLNRRSRYGFSNKISVSDKELEDIVEFAVLHTPSAFNSQSTRVVLLLGENHKKLWEITKETLRKRVAADKFSKTEEKIDTSFLSGYGTILFYEDSAVVEGLQAKFPSYADNFPVWSLETAGMHQLVVWTMLEDVGLGASLQHYNPLIDAEVAKTWDIDPKWKLLAQMPFGTPLNPPGEKTFQPLEERVRVFK